MQKIDVLDKGYVILHETLGTDLTVANSARVSYDKRTESMNEKDERLIRFLAREDHTSPFRHAMLQFEVFAPLMIARQHWKYVVGSDHTQDAWNESSRRYITEYSQFYIPDVNEWRSAPENSKQGSGEPLDDVSGQYFTEALLAHTERSEALYEEAMRAGICAEQARLFIPAYSMYVRYYWTASLQSVAHVINQRSKPDAQKEFQDYAHAIKDLALLKFPISIDVLTEVK